MESVLRTAFFKVQEARQTNTEGVETDAKAFKKNNPFIYWLEDPA